MDPEIRDKVSTGVTESQIRQMSRGKGYHGLLASGVNRMLQGLTTAEEVLGAAFTEKSPTEPSKRGTRPELGASS